MVHIMKTCKKCNIEFPATAEYFYKHTTTKDRLRHECKTCLLKSNKARVILWKEKYPEKKCSKRLERHSRDLFHMVRLSKENMKSQKSKKAKKATFKE